MISIMYGFKNEIPAEIISHPANCRLMQHKDNVSKYDKCSLTIKELLENIAIWDKKYGGEYGSWTHLKTSLQVRWPPRQSHSPLWKCYYLWNWTTSYVFERILCIHRRTCTLFVCSIIVRLHGQHQPKDALVIIKKVDLTGVVFKPKVLRLLVLWNAIHECRSTFCKDVCLGWIVYIRITSSSHLVLLLIWWLLLSLHTC